MGKIFLTRPVMVGQGVIMALN